MEMKFEMSKEEAIEFAKLVYPGDTIIDSSGQITEGYSYPKMKTVLSALRFFL
jgi:hypothetical protein